MPLDRPNNSLSLADRPNSMHLFSYDSHRYAAPLAPPEASPVSAYHEERKRERKIRCRLIYLATSYGAWAGKQARNLADNPCVCPHTLVDIQRRILVLTLSLTLVLLLTRL